MAVVSERDAAAMLDIVHAGATATGTDAFPPVVLTMLARLIPSDACVGYQEVDVARGGCRSIDRVEIVGKEHPPSLLDATHAFSRQNPMRDPVRFAEQDVCRLGDFFTRRELKRLDFYQEVWRPLGIDDALRVWFPAPEARAYALFLERGKRSYNERDRTIVRLLRPHLIRMHASAHFRRRVTRTQVLTEREHEVLGWIAQGKTNAEVAAILSLSPHTVRKHLENIFEKLDVRTRTAAVARARSWVA